MKELNIKKKRYIQNFIKKTYGFFEVMAASKEDAQRKFDDSDYGEFDNKLLCDETMKELTGETDEEYNKRCKKEEWKEDK